MGPYEDEATAARALSIAAGRNEEWDTQDEREADGGW